MLKKRRKDVSWKPLIQLLIKSKLPWWLYAFQLALAYGTGKIIVYVTSVTGEIIAGNIMDNAVVVRYSLLSVVQVILGLVTIVGTWVMIRFDNKIQTAAWQSFIRLPIRMYEKLVPSTLISRITEDATYVGAAVGQVIDLFTPLMTLTMFIGSMMEHSMKLTWTVVPVIVCYVLFLFFGQNWIFSISYQLQDAVAYLTGFLSEKMGNIKLIKANATEELEYDQGMKINRDRFNIELREARFQVFFESFQSMMDLLVTGLVIIIGAKMVAEGSIDMSALISFYMLSMMMPQDLVMLLHSLLALQRTKGMTAAVSEITDLSEEQIKRDHELDRTDQDIKLENVSFSYDGEHQVLKDVNLTIPHGKTTAIIGLSGSGKTTILKLLERFYELENGAITIGGINAEQIHLDSWRQKIGYVIQNSPLLSGTVRENILYGANREISETELQEVLEISNVAEFINELKNGLDTDIGDLGMKLSGGQRQRIAIARSIVNRPEILLLDEATANMDSLNETEISSAIFDLMQDKTVVVVAHNLKTIVNADQIILLDHGTVNGQGTHDELYQQNPLYRRLIDLQFQLSKNRKKEAKL